MISFLNTNSNGPSISTHNRIWNKTKKSWNFRSKTLSIHIVHLIIRSCILRETKLDWSYRSSR